MALVDRGKGLIYDTDINITWLQDANYAKTSIHGQDGTFVNWADAIQWVKNLHYAGYSDWRLPGAQPGCEGHGCSGGEIGHLWLVEGPKLQAGHNPFINIQLAFMDAYWTSTEVNTTEVWAWNVQSAEQKRAPKIPVSLQEKMVKTYVWPVRNGDCKALTIPGIAERISSVIRGKRL